MDEVKLRELILAQSRRDQIAFASLSEQEQRAIRNELRSIAAHIDQTKERWP